MNDPGVSKHNQAGWLLVFIAFLAVATATAGSLFLSNVMLVPVCELCWYQRIFLYPLVVILAIGLFPWNPGMLRTAGAFVLLGTLTAVFHLIMLAIVVARVAGVDTNSHASITKFYMGVWGLFYAEYALLPFFVR